MRRFKEKGRELTGELTRKEILRAPGLNLERASECWCGGKGLEPF